ncbi:MAG: Ribonuclease HII [Anaerolineales bacterium]|nr:Ribonuclease HII [Anaerolineales bacterium]
MPNLSLERRLRAQGYHLIAGIDEAGRGAWAGPVVAAAVILPLDRRDLRAALRGVNDSKQLTARQRERFYDVIHEVALAVGVGGAGPGEIDRHGIVAATRAAMERAVAMLTPRPDALLIDAINLQSLISLPQRSLNYGDSLSLSIAAASIVAKVSRDRAMAALDARYPGYGFARHKGYGTAAHHAALKRLGVTEIHRKSYAPVRALIPMGV